MRQYAWLVSFCAFIAVSFGSTNASATQLRQFECTRNYYDNIISSWRENKVTAWQDSSRTCGERQCVLIHLDEYLGRDESEFYGAGPERILRETTSAARVSATQIQVSFRVPHEYERWRRGPTGFPLGDRITLVIDRNRGKGVLTDWDRLEYCRQHQSRLINCDLFYKHQFDCRVTTL